MAKYSAAIEFANFNNKTNKEMFMSYVQAYFKEGLAAYAPNIESVKWTDLFHEYLRMEQKYPNNAYMPLTDLIIKFHQEHYFNPIFQEPEIFKLYKNAIGFIQDPGLGAYVGEREQECPHHMYFRFSVPVPEQPNLRAGYNGHLIKYGCAIPRYGELYIESESPNVGNFWQGNLNSPSDYLFVTIQKCTDSKTRKEKIDIDRVFSINIVRKLPLEFSK
ncbi:MAG: hypothetical protein LBK26_02745 [Rickettsiales bacterium]|jgi:hypothetical protein|nr:hypothetical protein [Rickettsiales bacterium]